MENYHPAMSFDKQAAETYDRLSQRGDEAATVAGLRLKERWAGWNREPFTADSSNCVSVYGR